MSTILALIVVVLTGADGSAQDGSSPARPDLALITQTLAEVKAVRAELVGHETDFDALLSLRARIDPLRDNLRALVVELDKKRGALKSRVDVIDTRAGPVGGTDQTSPEVEALQKERGALEKSFADIDAEDKQAQVALASADALWANLSEARRNAFSKRIFQSGDSPLLPGFWSRLFKEGLPATAHRSHHVLGDEIDQVRQDGATHVLEAFVGLVGGLAVAALMLRRWIARRASAQIGPIQTAFARRPALRHAFFVLVMRSLPLPLACALFYYAEDYLDLSSDTVDILLGRVAIAALLLGLSRGIMGALLSPGKPHLRLVDCSDETAVVVYDATIRAANTFVAGILLTAYADVISAPTSFIAAISLFVAGGTIGAFGHGLFLLRKRPRRSPRKATPVALPETQPPAEAAPLDTQRLSLNLAWTRPLLVLYLVAGLVAVTIGYVNLAGFLMSRLTIVVLVTAFAVLLSTFVDELFGHLLSSTSPTGKSVARVIGVSAGILDVISTSLAGLVRLVIVFVALLFAFGPWGIRFGDLNPFNDALLAFGISYVRISIGAAAYAMLEFVIGLVGTRIIVGWLERRLLPLTSLDPGVRNSMTTIVGYVGFAVTTIFVLSQLGVDPEKLAVVAGALSVGIGFGLQAITSNFISGLIVLAERPIRVGDVVTVKGEEGRVKKISVRSTLIAGFDRTDIIVPNTDILTSIVRNKSLTDREFRLKVSLLVDQDADQDAVDRIMLASAVDHEHVMAEPPPSVFFVRATDAGLEFQLRCFIDDLDNIDRVSSDLHFAILRQFRGAGIRLATKGRDDPAWQMSPPVG